MSGYCSDANIYHTTWYILNQHLATSVDNIFIQKTATKKLNGDSSERSLYWSPFETFTENTVCYKAKHSVLQGKKLMDQCIKKKPTKCGFTSWFFFVCKYDLSLVYDSC